MPLELRSTDVLLVIDVQNDFCPGGALPVPSGDEVVPIINRLATQFEHMILTQDWHPLGHHSFASTHTGRKPYESITTAYGEQTLWHDHCVAGTWGAEFHRDLDVTDADLILRKGFRAEIDSYSAFRENDRRTLTGLAGYLRERGFRRLFCCGLAYDFCVRHSAVDAALDGFESFIIEDASRAIGIETEAARREFREHGVRAIQVSDVVSS